MNFVIKVINGDVTKEYNIPDSIDVQCGTGDEIGRDAGESGVRCSIDVSDSSVFPTILREIEDQCGSFSNYDVQCVFNGVVIYEQENMSEIKYRLAKMKDATSIREELHFYA